MNQKIKAKWLAALRSGKYAQGCNTLRDKNDKFCCLGVLCDLYVKEDKSHEPWERSESLESDFHDGYTLFGKSLVLPEKVEMWAGLDCNDPIIHKTALSNYNDEHKVSLRVIADLIEKNL